MTKQEEIREGIANILMDCGDEYWKHCSMEAELILIYLHSQGVVLKVERELPKLKELVGEVSLLEKMGYLSGVREYQDQIRKAGFVAVEPFIEVLDE